MKDTDVDFVMLDGNVSHAISKLDRVRRNGKKFVCLNDNITGDYSTIRSLLIDFYLTFLPFPSFFELPNDYRNRFLYIEDYTRWKRQQSLVLCLFFTVLLLLILISFGQKVLPIRMRRILSKL